MHSEEFVFMQNWKRKENAPDHMVEKENNGVIYLTFPAIDDTGLVKHAFSTRMGGVSRGYYSTMNFSFTRGDDPDDVRGNYNRMASALGIEKEKMVLSWQTHTTNIRVVTEQDAGKGVVRDRDYKDIDGLMTDVPGLTLVTFFADCVPLYFVDTKNRAIALSHSGWRGTVNRMGEKTVEKMRETFGTDPKDLICAVGPSICKECYEVGEDVISEFEKSFSEENFPKIYSPKGDGKFLLDLWEANRIILTEAGVPPENISVTDICTKCNPDLLFSHRGMGEKRGNMCAFLSLI